MSSSSPPELPPWGPRPPDPDRPPSLALRIEAGCLLLAHLLLFGIAMAGVVTWLGERLGWL